jgi:hypothetical protein
VSPAEAFLALALCAAADEITTELALRAGGHETMVRNRGIRISIKVAVFPMYAKTQKRSKLVRLGAPAMYCGLAAWNSHQLAELNRRNNGQ